MRARVLLGALAACWVGQAAAEVYTWTDANGRVQYSDRPPKNFTGVVTRMQVDEPPPAQTVAPAQQKSVAKPPGPAQGASALRPGASEVADRRRAERERLRKDVDAAREKLSAARKALAEGQELKDDERQIVQRPGGDGTASPMPGVVPAASRSNCRTEVRAGKNAIVCPVAMPSDGYFDRIEKLEAAVKSAEREVAEAERAYRRGAD